MPQSGSPSRTASLDGTLRSTLTSQYHAALAMLRQAIELCPDDEWSSTQHETSFWRIAYHALYYTHLYLQADDSHFTPWELHQTGIQDLDDIPAPPHLQQILELPHRPPQTGVPFTKSELLTYWHICDHMVDEAVEAFDLACPETGFSWHSPPRPKVEAHISNIRHIQHHAAQLAGRVRHATGTGVSWVGTSRSE